MPGSKKTTLTDQLVGTAVRRRRNDLGMSQSALAKEVGVTFQQIQKYENGTNRMGAGRLTAIAEALEVPISYFFEGVEGAEKTGSPSAVGRMSEALREPGAMDLLRYYNQIGSEDHRLSVLRLARSLSGQGERKRA